MDKATEPQPGGHVRRLSLPALVAVGSSALSATRLAQGAPLDGVSLALHFLGVMAVLRLVHPLAEARRTRAGALVLAEQVAAAEAAGRSAALSAAAAESTSARATPSERFDAFAADPSASDGAYALPSGRTWLWSGPYAGVAFTVVLAVHTLFVPLLQVPLTLVLLPAPSLPFVIWWWRGRAARRARRGVAALLTPTQLIVRDAIGARSAAWSEVQALQIESHAAWDILRGTRRAPRLLISRRAAPPLLVRQDELGVPVEGALAVIEAYRGAVLGSAS